MQHFKPSKGVLSIDFRTLRYIKEPTLSLCMQTNFIKQRFAFYAVSVVAMIASLAIPFFIPLNLGIDMSGGIQAEYAFQGDFNKEKIVSEVSEVTKTIKVSTTPVVASTNVYRVSGENIFIVEAGFTDSTISEKDLTTAKNDLRTALSEKFGADSRYINIGASFGEYIKKTAYVTLALVILVISLYIAWAFRGTIEGFMSFSFGFVTAVSLAHDVVIAFGLYVLTSYFFPEFKVDTFFITAMLTVLGYSINDTIVVMDRIRSNLRLSAGKKQDFGVLINNSINDTLRRSIFTSLTVVIVLVALFFFGPSAITGFALALIFGSLVGTYSSVCIAAPLLYDITRKSSK